MSPLAAVAGQPLPLLVTSDVDLLDDLLRLAAAGCCEVRVAADPSAARRSYPQAPLVVIGLDQAPAWAGAGLPVRPRIVLVGRDGAERPPGDRVWECANLVGAEHVAMLPAAEPWLVDRFAGLAGSESAGRVVAVIGGRGGAGASVLSAGLAMTGLRTGQRTLLIDADPLGGGLDLVLGWEHLDGLRWPSLSASSGWIEPPALIEALPGRGDLVVLSWDRGGPCALAEEAMSAAMEAARRGRDLIVVDLPRQLDAAALCALRAADRVLLVVPAELRATASAARVAALAGPHCPGLGVVVRGPSPGGLTAGEVARALALPLIAELRPEPGLAGALERGVAPASAGRGPLASLCRRIVDDVIGASRSDVA